MILEQLNKIIFEIRLTEAQYKLPPNYNDAELTATAICHKTRREEDLARSLYNAVKEYALKDEHTW